MIKISLVILFQITQQSCILHLRFTWNATDNLVKQVTKKHHWSFKLEALQASNEHIINKRKHRRLFTFVAIMRSFNLHFMIKSRKMSTKWVDQPDRYQYQEIHVSQYIGIKCMFPIDRIGADCRNSYTESGVWLNCLSELGLEQQQQVCLGYYTVRIYRFLSILR